MITNISEEYKIKQAKYIFKDTTKNYCPPFEYEDKIGCTYCIVDEFVKCNSCNREAKIKAANFYIRQEKLKRIL